MGARVKKREGELERLKRVESGYQAVLQFLERMEELNHFQERIDLPAGISQIWETFLGDIHGLIRLETCALFLVDDQTGEFSLENVSPEHAGDLCREELRLQVECGVFPWILNRGRPGVVPSLAFKEEHSVILLPLSSPRRILGVAMVVTPIEESAITHENIKLLTLLTKQCSLVMENSLLYQHLQKEHESLIEAQSKILEAEKLASVGRLTAGASHEILNPLHILSGYLQLLERDKDLKEGPLRYVGIMKEQTERIARIVKSLVQFSEQENLQKRSLDIHDVLEGSLTLLAHEARMQSVELVKRFAPDLPWITGNEETLLQAFYNILSNALEAMPRGGRVSISTRALKDADEPGNHCPVVEVVFQDTGRGIAIEDRKNIFDPFFTSKETASGVGLGLSITYGVIREHGGTIEVDSEPGKGATFTVHLPAEKGRETETNHLPE